MKQFEIGKTYSTRSACNSDCIFKITVISRTASTITAFFDNKVEKYRISKKYSEYRDAETVLPLGSYSMAPMISAE